MKEETVNPFIALKSTQVHYSFSKIIGVSYAISIY